MLFVYYNESYSKIIQFFTACGYSSGYTVKFLFKGSYIPVSKIKLRTNALKEVSVREEDRA